MKKLLLLLLVIGGLVGYGLGGNVGGIFRSGATEKQTLPAQSVDKQITEKKAKPPIIPETIRIPKINVDAKVESVAKDAEGNMDVPKNADNAAWYSLGYKAGERGNAVLAGHLDKVDGSPSVFWDLKKLSQGDKIIVSDAQGEERVFLVVRLQNYPYNEFPLQEVFGPSSDSMLNLITCQGTWNNKTKNYSQRTVVYAKLSE